MRTASFCSALSSRALNSMLLTIATAGASAAAHAAACKVTDHQWFANFTKSPLSTDLLVARDLSTDGSGSPFNVTATEMRGYGGRPAPMHGDPWAGSVSGSTIKLKITSGSFFKGASFADQECTGTFSADCASIDWGPKGCLASPSKPGKPPAKDASALSWCGAWTPGCKSQVPAYGFGMSFWDVFDNNMVLQMEPAAAAVYGIATPTATAVSVTVTEHSTGTSYTVVADKLGINATHQPTGPEFAGMHSTAAPQFAWKALLKPAAAGGNYTLLAKVRTVFFSKLIILPRQARDKHRDNSQNRPFSCSAPAARRTASTRTLPSPTLPSGMSTTAPARATCVT